MRRYAQLRESGIPWIGEIPSDWKCVQIKRLTNVKRGASPRPIDDAKYFDHDGEFSWVRIADVTASERYLLETTQKLSDLGASLSIKRFPGDFFLSIAGTVGKPVITKIKCCIHDGFVWFPNLKINPEYLFYIFSTGLPYQGLGKLGTQLNLNTDTVGEIFIPLPSDGEILKIVEYLDEKTAQVDTLIEKKQKLIELLKEERKAIINDAVSGEGKNWEKKKLKYWLKNVTGGGTPSTDRKEYWNGNIPWVSPKDMKVDRIFSTEDFVTELAIEESSANLIPSGQVLIVVRSGILKHSLPVAINEVEVTLNQDMKAFEPQDNLSSLFLFWLLKGHSEEILMRCKKLGATVDSLEMDYLLNYEIGIPDINQQAAVIQHIETMILKSDATILTIQKEVELMHEYKIALISEVVTGKVKVI